MRWFCELACPWPAVTNLASLVSSPSCETQPEAEP